MKNKPSIDYQDKINSIQQNYLPRHTKIDEAEEESKLSSRAADKSHSFIFLAKTGTMGNESAGKEEFEQSKNMESTSRMRNYDQGN